MATIAEQLTSLANTKTAIKNAIVAKGVAVADTDPFSAYAGKIGQISGGGSDEPVEEWQPNPNWWDIKKILDEDTRDYAGKIGAIVYAFDKTTNFQFNLTGLAAVATSDGAFYTANTLHTWDTSQDKDDGRGQKTRWVICYFNANTNSNALTESTFCTGKNSLAYVVLGMNWGNAYRFFADQGYLECIDSNGYIINGSSFQNFCANCYFLQKLPDGLDTSNSTYFQGFCSNCYLLQKLPDGLDTSKGTSFQNFCQYCYSLQKLPDGLDTSAGTNFSYFCLHCYFLQKLPDGLDTSKGTTFQSFCSNCYFLQKLPDGLDTSAGTNFQNFCQNCYLLQKLPDGLDTSKGTSFGYFCSNCYSLRECHELIMARNATNFSSKYASPFNGTTLITNILLTLPSNTNFWLDASTRISIESFRYIADHAPDVTATPRTLTIGSTNITRCNEADPTIITDFNAKGWTVA